MLCEVGLRYPGKLQVEMLRFECWTSLTLQRGEVKVGEKAGSDINAENCNDGDVGFQDFWR